MTVAVVHDVTPSNLVDIVVTEIGMLPCTSGKGCGQASDSVIASSQNHVFIVPVVLRVRDEQGL